MSFNKIVPQLWMLQPKDIRDKIALDFNLPRTGITEIRDQDVITDGYCQADLDTITADLMTGYVGSTESFPRLWELTCMKAHSELNPPTVFIGSPEQLEQLQTLKEVSNDEFTQITGQPTGQKVEDTISTNQHTNGKNKKNTR